MKNVQVNTDGLQFDNANGTHTNVNTSASADTYINLPSTSGTLALTSDIVAPATPSVKVSYSTLSKTNNTLAIIDAALEQSFVAGYWYHVVASVLLGRDSGTVLNHRVVLAIGNGSEGWDIQASSVILQPLNSTDTQVNPIQTFHINRMVDSPTLNPMNITYDVGTNGAGARLTASFYFQTLNATETMNWQGAQSSTDAGNASSFSQASIIVTQLGTV